MTMEEMNAKYKISGEAEIALLEVLKRYLSEKMALDICYEFNRELQERKMEKGVEILLNTTKGA